MQQRRALAFLAFSAAVILACLGLLLFGGSPRRAAASVLQQVGATPIAAQGTVTAAALNVRAEPALTGRVVGTLRSGSQVSVLGQRGNWYQIEDARGPGGKGWVSARFIQIGNGNLSSGTGSVSGEGSEAATTREEGTGESQVLAPAVMAYEPPVLRWKWTGDTALLGDKDWYFDVQVIQKFDAYPYWTQVVEPPGKPKGARQQGDIYRVDIKAFDFRCDSSFVVRIAVRENGRFARWISPHSNLLLFTPVCQQSNPTAISPPHAQKHESQMNPVAPISPLSTPDGNSR